MLQLNEKYQGDKFKIGKALIEKFEHYFSRMFYISLPIFAFFIWILYRKSKQHFFVDHVIFSIHLYCAFYIFLFIVKIINLVADYFYKGSSSIIGLIATLTMLFYFYKSMKNHFGLSIGKTILKFFILSFLTIFLMLLLMSLFIMFSLFNI